MGPTVAEGEGVVEVAEYLETTAGVAASWVGDCWGFAVRKIGIALSFASNLRTAAAFGGLRVVRLDTRGATPWQARLRGRTWTFRDIVAMLRGLLVVRSI